MKIRDASRRSRLSIFSPDSIWSVMKPACIANRHVLLCHWTNECFQLQTIGSKFPLRYLKTPQFENSHVYRGN
jgi:hypothetical protein